MCTCAWTELHQALQGDGIETPASCGSRTRAWITDMVDRELQHNPQALAAARVLVERATVERAGIVTVYASDLDRLRAALGSDTLAAPAKASEDR